MENIKNMSIIILGLIVLITASLFDNIIENNFLCISIIFLFLCLETYSLHRIIKVEN